MTEVLRRIFLKSNRAKCSIDIDLVEQFIIKAKDLSVKHKVNVSDIIEAKRALEQERANDIQIQGGDYIDCHIENIFSFVNSAYNNFIATNPISFSDIKIALTLLADISKTLTKETK